MNVVTKDASEVSTDGVVFVVDDEPLVADIVHFALAKHGFKAYKFYDPLSALAFADTNIPSVLLSDFRMPVMNGLTLAGHIRERNPECKIVIMSGYVHEASNHPQRGICELVSKPVSISKLLAKVANALQSSMRSNSIC